MFQQKEFDYSQTPEVQTIYNEFVDAFAEKIIVNDFIPVLENACGEKCQILLKKLRMKSGQQLDMDEFSALFNFELTEPENFDCIYEALDQGKGKITIENLKSVNQRYNLGLSDEEIKTMITYTSQNNKDQPVTKSVFRTVIQ